MASLLHIFGGTMRKCTFELVGRTIKFAVFVRTFVYLVYLFVRLAVLNSLNLPPHISRLLNFNQG